MTSAFLRRGLSFAAIAAAAALASCGPSRAQLEAEAAAAAAAAEAIAANTPPPITLNESVAQSAAIYVAFIREAGSIRGGFTDAEAVQAAIRKGTAYESNQLAQGLISYASIIALQSPEYVAGIRQFASNRTQREEIVAAIVADPAYAATFPGADYAAGLIAATLGQDIENLTAAAETVEQDAYTIQERADPRRAWAVQHITNREVRLEAAKVNSAVTMLPSAEESARLFAAANGGTPLPLAHSPKRPPYTPAVVNALALAALAALGAAGENAKANTDALTTEPNTRFCLNISKLNLYQCLAASRPSYEDMFCLGRHVVRDLATCTSGATIVTPIISVSDPIEVSTPNATPVRTPSITPATISAPAQSTSAPATNGSDATAALNATPYTPAN